LTIRRVAGGKGTPVPRWAWITVGVLAFCATCVSLGFFAIGPAIQGVVSKSQGAVSEQMAETVATSVAGSIAASTRLPEGIEIREAELNVNNAVVFGEAGIETGTDGTVIYGFTTHIGSEGISLLIDGATAYSGVLSVQNGRVELTEVQASVPLFKHVLTADGFEQAMENGINQALSARGLVPVSLSLGEGVMTIVTRPSDSVWVSS
jgi:hypothetical protein